MRRPTPFGKYYLLDRVNVGGMAEVFRAKATGVEGFEKLVAIKRILPNIAEDDEFITMFIDEAKISVQLSHANIAQIYDLGKIDESYFIAMEFIAGKDLRTIFERSRKRGEILPISMSCYGIARVCEGLDYAHRKKDQQGRDLHIVHRDVSPQNILISYEGEVKLIDFGIAKAANKASKTQAGILKGKFGYMSPEQVRGLPIDRRSDVFAVGIVLYEMLTGERLFVGESDFSTLEKVRNVEIMPPTTYNRRIPDELEAIVLKALAREPEERYQSAGEVQEDLSRLLASGGHIFSRRDLAQYMKGCFNDDMAREEQALALFRENQPPPSAVQAALQSRSSAGPPPLPGGGRSAPPPTPRAEPEGLDDDQKTRVYDGRPGMMDEMMAALGNAPPGEPIVAEPSRGRLATPIAQSGPSLEARAELRAFSSSPELDPQRSSGPHSLSSVSLSSISLNTNIAAAPMFRERTPLQQSAKRRKVLMLVTGVALFAAAAFVFVYLRGVDSGRPASFELTTTAGATIEICQGPGKTCRAVGTTGTDGRLTAEAPSGKVVFVVTHAGCEKRELPTTLVPRRPNPLPLGDLVCTAAAGQGALRIETEPTGATVRFTRADLAAWAGPTPYLRGEVPAGEYELEVSRPDYFPQKLTITAKPAGEQKLALRLIAQTVRLEVETEPAGARVVVRDKAAAKVVAEAKKTPAGVKLTRSSLTAAYAIELSKKGFEPWSVDLRFDGQPTQKLSTGPVALLPKSDDKPSENSEKPKKPKKTKNAKKETDEPIAVAVASASASASEDAPAPKPELGTLDVNLKGAWAYVRIDGRDTGKPTPLVGLRLTAGRYRVTLFRDELGFFEEFMVVIAPNKTTRALRVFKARD